MTELPRLLDASDDDFERALLSSVQAELPGASGLRDTALALGLTASAAEALAAALPATSLTAIGVEAGSASVGSASVSSASASFGTAGTGAAIGSGTTTTASASLALLGKSLLGGALATVLGLTAVDQVLGSAAPRVTSAAVAAPGAAHAPPPMSSAGDPGAVAVAAPALAQELPPAASSYPAVARRFSPLPEPAEPSGVSAPRGAAPANAAFAPVALPPASSPAVARNPSLAAEIRQLDRARAALAAGDVAGAGRALEVYGASRPSPTLAQEAALLRVRLLLAEGRRAAASELARSIINQHPSSAHVESLRSLANER